MTLPEHSPEAASRDLPDPLARLQQNVENLYLAKKALEHELARMKTLPPVILTRPERLHPAQRMLMRLLPGMRRRFERRLIRQCGLFDPVWYLATYPDVRDAGMDPLEHFLAHAGQDRRSPGPHFDTAHYMITYPDIAAHNINPLVHYVLAGCEEGRSIRPSMPHADTA